MRFIKEIIMICNAKEHKLKIGHTEIRYITFGKGEKPLVMIQGLHTRTIKGMAVPIAYMYRIFALHYKVYLFDRRTNISENVTIRSLAADVAMAMDSLGIANADIFGVSQGGMIAQYLAMDRADLVNKLVLAVTLSRNNDTVKTVIKDWIELTEQDDIKGLAVNMASRIYSDAYIKKYRPFLPLMAILQKPKDVQRFIRLAGACLTCNTYEELERIKCPVFVIGGWQDKVVTGEASREIAEKIGCKIYMYEKLGHAAYEEAQDFNKRVYQFLLSQQ